MFVIENVPIIDDLTVNCVVKKPNDETATGIHYLKIFVGELNRQTFCTLWNAFQTERNDNCFFVLVVFQELHRKMSSISSVERSIVKI